MDLRTAVLLFLCVSMGMSATLVTYQTGGSDEEAPVIDVEHAGKDPTEDDPPAAEGPEANSSFGNSVAAELLAREEGAVDEATLDVSVADGATAEKPGTDNDSRDGDVPPLETFTGEAVTQKQPSSSSSVEEGNNINPDKKTSPNRPLANEESSWSFNSIRNSFQSVHGYVDSLVELVGGHNGVCQYRCRYGKSRSLH